MSVQTNSICYNKNKVKITFAQLQHAYKEIRLLMQETRVLKPKVVQANLTDEQAGANTIWALII